MSANGKPLRREPVEIQWGGQSREVHCTAGLLMRIEARPEGVSVYDVLREKRVSEMAWVYFCAVREAGFQSASRTDVLAWAMDHLEEVTTVAMNICMMLVTPLIAIGDSTDDDAAPEVETGEGAGAPAVLT